ncbi:MAG: GNAT family N-acetyltransferase [Herpetosiphonaceae bacterium]|nr:GNAT family N-acetyltransferase [Herpetosiphonaceae bacterium]
MDTSKRPEVVPGERIFFTTLRKEDVPLFTEWFSNLELTAYLGELGRAYRLEDEQQWYDSLAKQENLVTFGIVVRASERLIGTVSLMDMNHRHQTAVLGIAIGDSTAWNQGYGTEAVRLMSEYGFFFHDLHCIRLWHVAFNERGHRAYLKAGFREAGRWRGSYSIGGERYDSVMMDITRDEADLGHIRTMIGSLGKH